MIILEPIKLSDEDRGVVHHILEGWINTALNDRGNMEDEWREDLRTYEGIPKLKQKNFPWPGASNLEIPMKAIVTDVVQARLHSAIYGQIKLWVASTEDPRFAQITNDIEDFFDMEAKNRIGLERSTIPWEHEAILLGTGWLKGAWLDARRIANVSNFDGTSSYQEVFDHYGPSFDAVPIENILVPSDAREVNGPFRCQWIDHIAPLRWDELKSREAVGYERIDDVEHASYGDWGQEIKEERERLMGIEKTKREGIFDVHEIWCYFPVHQLDSFPHTVSVGTRRVKRDWAECVITWHRSSNTILRFIENWNEAGIRPLFNLRYTRRTNSVYGRGIGRMIHTMTQSLNVVHNQRIDNATVANTRIWKARKNAFPRSTQITPSKIFWMDDPATDLIPEQAGDVYPSSVSNEMVLRDYIERRTGVVDYTLGKESPVGKYSATATSTMALLQEGTRKFDFTIADWHQDWGMLATWMISVYKQYGFAEQGLLEQTMGPERAGKIIAAFQEQSSQPVLNTFKFKLMATTAADSKSTRMQENQLLLDLTERIYGGVLGLMRTVVKGVDETGQPIQPAERLIAWEGIEAGLALFKRILHAFDVKDTEAFMPDMTKLQEAIGAGTDPNELARSQADANVGGGAGANGGAPGGAAGPAQGNGAARGPGTSPVSGGRAAFARATGGT